MQLGELLTIADEMKPNTFSETVKTRWVNEIEGMIQTEVLLLAFQDCVQYKWPDSREIDLLVPPPSRKGQPLKASVAALYECYGLACTMYVNQALVLRGEGNDSSEPATPVQDSVPGLQQVTEPPAAGKNGAATPGGLEEHSL